MREEVGYRDINASKVIILSQFLGSIYEEAYEKPRNCHDIRYYEPLTVRFKSLISMVNYPSIIHPEHASSIYDKVGQE